MNTATVSDTRSFARCAGFLGMTLRGESIRFTGTPNGLVAHEVSQVNINGDCTVQKSAWIDEAVYLHRTQTVWQTY